jgi:hypothetical protein
MHTTIPQSSPYDPSPADLMRAVLCPMCWSSPGRPCSVSGPPADYLARYVAAVKQGLLSRAELEAIIAGIEVIADHVYVTERAA